MVEDKTILGLNIQPDEVIIPVLRPGAQENAHRMEEDARARQRRAIRKEVQLTEAEKDARDARMRLESGEVVHSLKPAKPVLGEASHIATETREESPVFVVYESDVPEADVEAYYKSQNGHEFTLGSLEERFGLTPSELPSAGDVSLDQFGEAPQRNTSIGWGGNYARTRIDQGDLSGE